MSELCLTPTPAASPSSPGISATRDLVLLVEDNEAIARMLQLIIGNMGLRVLWCPLGATALAEYGKHEEEVVLVFADCKLPDMDGRTVCHMMRTGHPSLPILITSGNVALRNLAPLEQDSLVSFLPKPYTPREIMTRMQALMQAARMAA